MTRPTQPHVDIVRCQHEHDGLQCQLDAEHDLRLGTACVATTIGQVDTITRWTHNGDAQTLEMPSRAPYTAIKNPNTGKRTKLCAECPTPVVRTAYKYCCHECMLKGRYKREAAARTRRRQERQERGAA